jgi:hypothetical protein
MDKRQELEEPGAADVEIATTEPGRDSELEARVEGMTHELDQVLDVEAGLAEALSAGKAVDHGLDRLFRRLGPPAED